MNEELRSFNFQFTKFFHFREGKKKKFLELGCPYFLVCATVFIPLIPPSLGLYRYIFSSSPLFDWRVLFVSYLSYTERTKINGKENRIDENASIFLLRLFLPFVVAVSLVHIECSARASGLLRHHSHRLGLFLTIF